MTVVPVTKEAIDLFNRGTEAFAEVEAAGMRVDTDYLDRQTKEIGDLIKDLEADLRNMEEFRLQSKRFGADTNVRSRDQLATVLAKDMGVKFTKLTDGGKPQLDDVVLESIGTPYTEKFRRVEKFGKLHGTYLVGISREVCDGFVHPSFNLNLVRSFRSSSSDPNFQNIPVRDDEISKIIRSAFIPRDDSIIVDLDYSSQEVRVACSVSGDPKLTKDTLEGDMHRDMAAECFMLGKDQVTKKLRGTAKGGFVFAEFYGDYYKQVCKNLWDSAVKENLTTVDGKSIIEHLAECGIHRRGECSSNEQDKPGTFERHIKEVEDKFWNVRYRKYHEYRQNLVKTYTSQGYFSLATGFVCSGVYTKNQIINYPVQGPAFHCLLWSLIQLIKEMRKKKMKSKIVGQIHDSIVADILRSELDDYLEMVNRIMVKDLMNAWPWLTVPLEIEIETSETNWYEKKTLNINKG